MPIKATQKTQTLPECSSVLKKSSILCLVEERSFELRRVPASSTGSWFPDEPARSHQVSSGWSATAWWEWSGWSGWTGTWWEWSGLVISLVWSDPSRHMLYHSHSSQETGGDPDLWRLVSRGDQHCNPSHRQDSNPHHFLEVMHYVAPPKIKSTNDFTSRIEARSARANAPVGQVNFETKLDQVDDQFFGAGHCFGEGPGPQTWRGDLLNQDLWY